MATVSFSATATTISTSILLCEDTDRQEVNGMIFISAGNSERDPELLDSVDIPAATVDSDLTPSHDGVHGYSCALQKVATPLVSTDSIGRSFQSQRGVAATQQLLDLTLSPTAISAASSQSLPAAGTHPLLATAALIWLFNQPGTCEGHPHQMDAYTNPLGEFSRRLTTSPGRSDLIEI
jgi:hypothetical protein